MQLDEPHHRLQRPPVGAGEHTRPWREGGRGLTKPTQINIAHLDENGVYTGQYSTVALAGKVRSAGDSDSAIDLLWQKKKAGVGQA